MNQPVMDKTVEFVLIIRVAERRVFGLYLSRTGA